MRKLTLCTIVGLAICAPAFAEKPTLGWGCNALWCPVSKEAKIAPPIRKTDDGYYFYDLSGIGTAYGISLKEWWVGEPIFVSNENIKRIISFTRHSRGYHIIRSHTDNGGFSEITITNSKEQILQFFDPSLYRE